MEFTLLLSVLPYYILCKKASTKNCRLAKILIRNKAKVTHVNKLVTPCYLNKTTHYSSLLIWFLFIIYMVF